MSLADEMQSVELRISALAGTRFAAPAGDFATALANAMPAASTATAGRATPEIAAIVDREATRNGIDPSLVNAVIANESSFDPQATSWCGARGLMQLMPETAANLGVSDPYDPAQNIAGGARYLKSLLTQFGGDVRLAVAAYNAGPGAVQSHGGVPPYAETRTYVDRVLASYADYRGGARS